MKNLQFTNFDYEQEVKKCKSLDDVMGKNGLIQRMLKDVIQNILEAEMEEHLGREKYDRSPKNENKNYRNGYSKKI